MNTSLIRKIIGSDLPRREQDLLILLAMFIDSDQKKRALDDYYIENEPKSSKTGEPSDDEIG